MIDRSRYPKGERHIDVPVYRRTCFLLIAVGIVMVIAGLATASWVLAGLGAFLAAANVGTLFAPSWFHSSGT
ncbi:MAG TPA: hypothetical protein VK507_18770 [Iamia sp.]|nr:hypothetical protein [Iamia sp.]